MIKTLIVHVTAYYPPHIGGMENCVREIAERTAQNGSHVEVFTSNINCKIGRPEPLTNLKINYLNNIEIAHTPFIPSLFFRLMKLPNESVIHLHVSQVFLPEIVYVVSKIKKIPYVAHVHLDVGPSGRLGFLLPLYKKTFLKHILNSASKIIVPTQDYVHLISKKYGVVKSKIAVIPSGVNLEHFRQGSAVDRIPARILFVGRLSKQKNVPLLIQSFKKALLSKGCKNINLQIVGDGEERQSLEDLVKSENLTKQVIFRGVLRGSTLYKIYANSDIFILTSREESFGIVLIEAMASGLPIIASDIPGLRNVVENGTTGLLVTPSVENFATAIQKMVTNTSMRGRFINNGLKTVKKYDWNKIVEDLEGIYSEVIK